VQRKVHKNKGEGKEKKYMKIMGKKTKMKLRHPHEAATIRGNYKRDRRGKEKHNNHSLDFCIQSSLKLLL